MLVDLNALIDPSSGWVLETAKDVNNHGAIVGRGTHDGQTHAYLLTPSFDQLSVSDTSVSEPGSGTAEAKFTVKLSDAPTSAVTVDYATHDGTSAHPAVAGSDYERAAGSLTFAPGETSKTVTVTVDATGERRPTRTFTLDLSNAQGADIADGQAVGTIRGLAPLTVSVTFDKNDFKLADTDDGPVPQDVTASVSVTNKSTVKQTGVTLPAPPDLLVIDPNSVHLPFPVDVTEGPTPSGDLGNLAPGETSAPVTFRLHVTNNGDFTARQLVLSADEGTSTNRASIGSADLHVNPTALLRINAKLASDLQPPLPTGRLIRVEGKVVNLSQTKSLDLDALHATVTGNGGGGDLVKPDATPTPDGYLPPIHGILKPGESQSFDARVQTVADGGTRTTLTYSPAGRLVNTDGTETALTPDQIRLTQGTSPLVVSLDDSAPPVEEPDGDVIAWNFTSQALENLQLWAANGFNAITDLPGLVGAGGGIIQASGHNFLELLRFARAEEALHLFWYVLTPEQRRQFADEVSADLKAADDKAGQLQAAVNNAVFTYFADFEAAFQSGDLNRAASIAGAKAGYGLPEALATLFPNVILGKVARGLGWGANIAGKLAGTPLARVISLADKLRESQLVAKGAKKLADLKVGDNLFAKGGAALRKVYGMSDRDARILSYWAKQRGLLIAVRSRNPVSLYWRKLKALLKPEAIKIKNVDEIDAKFLGYVHQDIGTVVLKKPDPIAEITRRLHGASPALKKAVLKRHGQRFKEWLKYHKEYKALSTKGTIDIGFDAAAQGVKQGKHADIRKFHLKPVAGHHDYYHVLLGDKGGILRRITGDIDIVAICRSNGLILSAAERANLYADLIEAIGIQHGETLSWLLNGDVLASAKAALLGEHVPGGELLAVFGPDGGARAAFFDPALTIFNSDTHEIAATFIGAYSSPFTRFTRYIGLNLGSVH
jgi:hypothetical protein